MRAQKGSTLQGSQPCWHFQAASRAGDGAAAARAHQPCSHLPAGLSCRRWPCWGCLCARMPATRMHTASAAPFSQSSAWKRQAGGGCARAAAAPPPQAPGSWSRPAVCSFGSSMTVSQPLRTCLQGAPSLQAPAHPRSPAVLGAPWPGGGGSLLAGMPMQCRDRWPAPCDISGGQNRSLTIHLARSCQPPKPAPRPSQLPQFACLAARHTPSCRPHSLPSPW